MSEITEKLDESWKNGKNWKALETCLALSKGFEAILLSAKIFGQFFSKNVLSTKQKFA